MKRLCAERFAKSNLLYATKLDRRSSRASPFSAWCDWTDTNLFLAVVWIHNSGRWCCSDLAVNLWKSTVLLVVTLVYKEPDMGTACMIFFIAAVMLFVAGLSFKYIGIAAAVAMPVVYFAVAGSAYRLQRVETFFSPGSDPQGHGFQLLQSLIAVGSGGFSGVGLMESRQKLFFLPEAHTDFIFR